MLGFWASDVSKCRYQLIKVRIYTWPTNILDSRLAVAKVFNILIDLRIGLSNELDRSVLVLCMGPKTYGSEEMMERILAHGLSLLMMLS